VGQTRSSVVHEAPCKIEQQTLDGKTIRKPKGRLSFFKRMFWQKGEPVAEWEDVILAVRRDV